MSLFNCPKCNKPYQECICEKKPIAVITAEIPKKIKDGSYTAEDKISIPTNVKLSKTRYNAKKEIQNLQNIIQEIQKQLQELQKQKEPTASFVKLNDIQVETAYEALNRVIRQLSGNRSMDYKSKAIPLRDFLQNILIKKGIIQSE